MVAAKKGFRSKDCEGTVTEKATGTVSDSVRKSNKGGGTSIKRVDNVRKGEGTVSVKVWGHYQEECGILSRK